jgi:hypothetical protein
MSRTSLTTAHASATARLALGNWRLSWKSRGVRARPVNKRKPLRLAGMRQSMRGRPRKDRGTGRFAEQEDAVLGAEYQAV